MYLHTYTIRQRFVCCNEPLILNILPREAQDWLAGIVAKPWSSNKLLKSRGFVIGEVTYGLIEIVIHPSFAILACTKSLKIFFNPSLVETMFGRGVGSDRSSAIDPYLASFFLPLSTNVSI